MFCVDSKTAVRTTT